MRGTCIAIAVLTASAPVLAEEAAPATTVRLRGKLRDSTDRSMIVGGTVVASPEPDAGQGVQVAITGEDGSYAIEVPPGTYAITAYYADNTVVRSGVVAATAGTVVDVADISISARSTGCTLLLIHIPGAEGTAQPYFGLTVPRHAAPLSRDRTHRAWIAPAPAADARTTVTTIGHGVRLHGAPGIPTVFLEDVTTSTLRAPIASVAGSGGATDVVLRSGTNEVRAVTRSVLALDHTWERTELGFAQESFLGGPIVKDELWGALGLVADADGRKHGMARVNYGPSHAHQAELTALAQDTGTARDGWAKVGWKSHLDDSNRTELRASVIGERLELVPEAVALGTVSPTGPELVDRVGGALDFTARFKALGYHMIALHASAGAGSLDDERHRDHAFAAGDRWEVRPNVTIEAGVRSDTRTTGTARTGVVSPRLALAYDLTREGRSELFVAAQRVPHLDDGFIGAWRGAASTHHDELTVGASYQPPKLDAFMAGVALRTQRDDATGERTGVDGWLRLDRGGSLLHAAASTLNRAGVLFAQYRLARRCRSCREDATGFTATAALRTQQIARVPGEAGVRIDEASLGLGWHRRGKGGQPTASLELHDGTIGTGARFVFGAVW